MKSIDTVETSSLFLISEEPEIQTTVVDLYKLSYECLYFGKSRFKKSEQKAGQINSLKTLQSSIK